MKIAKIIIMLVIISFMNVPLTAFSAPSVSGVSGTFTNDQSVTISGLNFGSPPTDVSFLTFENGTVGTVFNESGWLYKSESITGAPWKAPRYTDTIVYNGKKSMLCSFPPTVYACVFEKMFDTPITKAYVTFWIYADFKQFSASSQYHAQWKIWRVNPTEEVSDSKATFYFNNWPQDPAYNNGENCYQSSHMNEVDGINVTSWNPSRGPAGCFPHKEWLRVEIYLKESDPNVENGNEIVNLYSTKSNTWRNWSKFENIITRSDSTQWQWMHFGQYIGNDSTAKDANIYYDDVYVQRGTYARIEVCDNASWSSCGKRAIQKPATWSDNSITINANTGSFANAQQVYLFVVDDAGNASNGWPVTVGATVAPPAPPPTTPPPTTTTKPRWRR